MLGTVSAEPAQSRSHAPIAHVPGVVRGFDELWGRAR